MATANIPDSKLQAALAEVEQELRDMAKAEQEKAAKLAKAREESGSAPSGSAPSASGSPSPEGSAGGGAPPSGSAPPAADGSAPPAAPSADPAAGSAPPTGDPAAAGAGAMPTLEQIVAEYSKLPPEELKLYYLGIKTALAQIMGAGMDPSASAGAPGAGAPPAPSAPPSAPPAPSAPPMSPMGKSESEKAMESKLVKSEQAVAEMQKDLATLSKALELVVGQPQRKGVTGIEYVKRAAPQSEPEAKPVDPTTLAKSELSKSLIGMVRSGKSATGQKLSKSDMDNISKFSEGGSKDLTLVKHLFAPAAK